MRLCQYKQVSYERKQRSYYKIDDRQLQRNCDTCAGLRVLQPAECYRLRFECIVLTFLTTYYNRGQK